MSAASAETFARAAQEEKISPEEKMNRIAKALVELAKAVGEIQSDVRSIRR